MRSNSSKTTNDPECTKPFISSNLQKVLPLPLYAALPPSEQVKVFLQTPPNARKIVFSTNISETSVTIDGIEHVIDPGFVKQKIFSPKTGMETLSIVSVSKVSATQRAGRAGRTRPGNCYRLYTKTYFQQMQEETQPEIQRSNLTSVVLLLKAMKVKGNFTMFYYRIV
jgi:HrpA-like RNA helicase